MKKNPLNDPIICSAYFSNYGIINWLYSRKAHRKARWLRKVNRAMNYVEDHGKELCKIYGGLYYE